VRHHPKSVLAITLSVAASIWWVSIQNYSSHADERIYSRQECAEDLSRISYDMAQLARYRGDINNAILHFKKAIEHKPDELPPYQKLCACYENLGQHEQALNMYFTARRATTTNSARRAAHDTRSLLQNPLPWQGENITGKKLYVDADHSLEDSICFLRFLPRIKPFKAMVFCKVPHALLSLCTNSLPSIHFFSNVTAEQTPSCDYYIPITSLPSLLTITLKTLTPSTGYLTPDATHVVAKKTLLKPSKLHVGLWWHDTPKNTAPLSLLQETMSLPNVQCYALQPLQQLSTSIIDASNECQTLNDTAAFIKNMDLIVTVDGVLPHLAGAIGTPVWLLAKHSIDDWRWLVARKGNNSPWYPGMRIFQQPKAGDWLSVIADVHEELAQMKQK
jgi:hypothetical protein